MVGGAELDGVEDAKEISKNGSCVTEGETGANCIDEGEAGAECREAGAVAGNSRSGWEAVPGRRSVVDGTDLS